MIEQLAAYLRKKGEPASSQELARQVLKINEAPAVLADKLVQTIVESSQNIVRDPCGLWQIVDRPVSNQLYPFFLLKAFPTHVVRWQQWQACACGKVNQTQNEYKLFPGIAQAVAFLLEENRATPLRPLLFEGFDRHLAQWRLAFRYFSGQDFLPPILTLRRVAALLFPGHAPTNLSDLARLLNVTIFEEADPELHVQSMAALWQVLWERLQVQGILSLDELFSRLTPSASVMDFSRCAFDEQSMAALPVGPGVYVMRDAERRPFYVGKAKSLIERVGTYFLPVAEIEAKLSAIRRRLVHLQIVPTGSELEALLLENKLIKEHNPDLNIQVQVRARKHKQKSRYPRILIMPSDLDASFALYFLHPEKSLLAFCMQNSDVNDRSSVSIFAQQFRSDQWDHIESKVQEYFFNDRPVTGDDAAAEIAISWLSLNEDAAESIDMRTVLSAKETVRLLQAYLGFERNHEKRIFY